VKYSRIAVSLLAFVSVFSPAAATVGAAPAASSASVRQITLGGSTSFTTSTVPSSPGIAGVQALEFSPAGAGPDAANGIAPLAVTHPAQSTFGGVNRSRTARNSGNGESDNGDSQDGSNPQLKISFDGLNHRQQRLANGGNQFSIEPPDQGLCAGNGFVMESLNDVIRVYDTSGNALGPVVDTNSFYGYAPAITRATASYGPEVTDPSCLYDNDTQRWFQVILTLDHVGTTGALAGTNHLDIAVSKTSSPLGGWNIYRVASQNDGTAGTPDHHCSLNLDGSGHGPCFADYPHIGADKNGFYITTNEYSFNGPEFKSANIYALSKHALAAGAGSVTVTVLDTVGADMGKPGFTVWPATSPAGQVNPDKRDENRGTEYFLSSNAADEATCPYFNCASTPGASNNIVLWKLGNTASLDNASPSVWLSSAEVGVRRYSIPPKSDQKVGNNPLGQCLNDTACSTFLLGVPDPYTESLSQLDSNDSRMQQVTYANGYVWGALDTAVKVRGASKAGIEYFIVDPDGARLANQGLVSLPANNLTYPAIGVTSSGKGVMAFTVVGHDYYPSAGYAGIDAANGVGPIHIAAAGLGPDDGFTSYKAYVGDPPRTRWGDYGAAAVDGNNIWIASEYIGQTCTLVVYTSAPFGSCGGTRTTLGNWDTRISLVQP